MKKKRKIRQRLSPDAQWELRCDKRSAEFVARMLEEMQEDLADLLPELRTLKRYHEMQSLTYVLSGMENLRSRCQKFVDTGAWTEDC